MYIAMEQKDALTDLINIDELCVEDNILRFFELQSFHGLLQVIDKEILK